MRSISEELSELKTSLWGYDKEAVQLLIRQILLENEEQLEKETSKLIKQNRSLELELNESRERLELMTKQFEHLSEKLDRMTEVMGKGTEYSKERDQELREFHKKETEIETLYEKAQQEAMAERDRLLADVEKEQEALMEQAQAERNALIEEGKARKQQLIQEGMEEKQHLEEEMEQFAINQKKIQAVLAEIFTRNQFIVSGDAYHDFARYLAVCMMRSRMGFPVTEGEDSINRPGRLAMELVEEIEKVCGYHFQEMEMQNVEARLKELNMVCKETDIQLDMLQKLEVFIQRVQEETGLKLQVERDLLEVLSDHVSRMELRIQNGRNNIGNHTKEMAKRYPLEMHLLRTCLSPVLNTEIPDAEMGYLVLYFASAIERNRRKPDILFISDQSASSIYNVQNKLKGFLGERISEITVIPEYLFEQRKERYCRNYQLRITSEKELVLKDASFTYLDLFADNEQIMRLGRNVDKLENNYWKETEEKLRKKYGTKDSLYLIEEVADFDDLKKRIGYEYPEQKVSKETIGSSRLSMIDHEQDGRNKIYRIYLKKPFPYGGKQITEVIAAHYGGEGDMIEFFDYVKELLGGQS